MVVCHGDARGTECVCFDDVGSCLQVFAVDVGHHIRTGQTKQVIVALHLPGYILKPLAAEIFFTQVVFLNHGPHRSVKDKDATGHQLLDCIHHILMYNSRMKHEESSIRRTFFIPHSTFFTS